MAENKHTIETTTFFKEHREIVYRNPAELKPWPNNPRKHSDKQIKALISAISKVGFQVPIIVNESDLILTGHGRVEAAQRMGLAAVPVIVAAGLTAAQQRAFVIGDNKLSSLSSWDNDLLIQEIEAILQDEFEIESTGFTTGEIDILLDDELSRQGNADDLQPGDCLEQIAVSRVNDVWLLDRHRLVCGNALKPETFGLLMHKDEYAQMCITDPPYNVKIDNNVCGSGKIKHKEFLMASGEMSVGEFTDFLATACENIAAFCKDGAIVYCFMDWRHMREMQNAGEQIFGQLRQLCVWHKDNAGMGTFYRSHHELILIFRHGDAPHINNFELGQTGRYRTNVWSYPGANTLAGNGYKQLEMHPTVKPVSMIADAIRDCSKRNGIILDPFAGSGTILIAAERTGRRARAIELEPEYVDVAIRRWERVTGKSAMHEPSGMTFSEREQFFAAGGKEDGNVII